MEILTYKKDEGLLWIEIEISGTPTWYYYYNEDQFHENDNAIASPKEHTIGKPHELIRKTHNWLFRLANVSSNTISCDVTIVWKQIQGANDITLHSWSENNISVPANSGKEIGNSILLNPV